MFRPKIALIGAVSLIFSVAVINDVSRTDTLQGSDLRLVDINQLGLQVVWQVVRKLARAKGRRLKVSATTELGMALERSQEFVYRALELDPYTRSTDQAAQYVQALADVNKEYLPWLG